MKIPVFLFLLSGAFTGASAAPRPAGRVIVETSAGLIRAVHEAVAGDEIIVRPGRYELAETLTLRVAATEAAPLLLRSETPGAAILTGADTLWIRNSQWVTVEGFVIAHQLLPRKSWLRVLDSAHVRLTRLRLAADDHDATEKDAYNSIGIEQSTQVRVDHCEFGPRTTRSTGDYIASHVGSRYLQIDHNYFQHRANIGQNGGESVMLHGAGLWAHYAVVEHNLFERCNGEGEMLGLKSSHNTVRGNTILDCEGAISIRDGSYNKVYGNLIVHRGPRTGAEGNRVGGVRIFGTHNEVVNNYFAGLTMPLQSGWGDADPPYEENGSVSDRRDHGRDLGYIASHDNLIAHNTIVDCDSVLVLAKTGIAAEPALARIAKVDPGSVIGSLLETYRAHTAGGIITPHLAPRAWLFFNNLSVNNREFITVKVARDALPPYLETGFVHRGNVNFSTDPAFGFGPERHFANEEWQTVDPQWQASAAGFYELSAASPLRGRGRHEEALLASWLNDAETRAELEKCHDIGAGFRPQPLTPQEVGVAAP